MIRALRSPSQTEAARITALGETFANRATVIALQPSNNANNTSSNCNGSDMRSLLLGWLAGRDPASRLIEQVLHKPRHVLSHVSAQHPISNPPGQLGGPAVHRLMGNAKRRGSLRDVFTQKGNGMCTVHRPKFNHSSTHYATSLQCRCGTINHG